MNNTETNTRPRSSAILTIVGPAILGLVLIANGYLLISAVGIAFTSFLFFSLLDDISNRIPIEKIILFMAALQWILGPFLTYHGYGDHYKYYMYVEEPTYMALAVPGVFAFWLGISLFRSKETEEKGLQQLAEYKTISPTTAYYLIGVGLFFVVLGNALPTSLQFARYLLSNLSYIGLLYLLQSDTKNKWLFIAIAMGLTFLTALRTAMFHDFILWSILLFIYIAYVFRFELQQKIIAIFIGLLVIVTIQVVKMQYRQMAWGGEIQGSQIEAYSNLVGENVGEGMFSYGNMLNIVNRINQGWIISRIMDNVPTMTDFADGETVKDAVMATMVPRFLNPNKKIAGGKENFERFTGYNLESGTSMGISLLGEGYANFGVWGGIIFMFFIGAFYSYVIRKIYDIALTHASVLLWFPLLFFHVVKAETEMVVVFNYLVKSIILVALFFWASKRFLKLEL